jgi:hypothetical protein
VDALTESTVHLRDEIVVWRQARAALRRQLAGETRARQMQVSGLLAAFAGDLAGARRAWFGAAPAGPRAAELDRQQRPAQAAPAGPREHPQANPPEPAHKAHYTKQKKH